MATYRRIVEIHTGEQKNLYRTVRIDLDGPRDDKEIAIGFADLLEAFRRRYETQIRFVTPNPDQFLPGYLGSLPGEAGWDWADEDEKETF